MVARASRVHGQANALGHTEADVVRSAAATLLEAREELVASHYRPDAHQLASAGRLTEGTTSLLLSMQHAGEGGVGLHYAARHLFRVAGMPLANWEAQHRTHEEAVRLLDAALLLLGVRMPPPRLLRHAAVRQGGWRVTPGRPSAAEVERRRALLAAPR